MMEASECKVAMKRGRLVHCSGRPGRVSLYDQSQWFKGRVSLTDGKGENLGCKRAGNIIAGGSLKLG